LIAFLAFTEICHLWKIKEIFYTASEVELNQICSNIIIYNTSAINKSHIFEFQYS